MGQGLGRIVAAGILVAAWLLSSALLAQTGVFEFSRVLLTTDADATPAARMLFRDSIVVAWASVANSGTPAISDDVNVASLTDNGVGDVTLTFATAIASATFACIPTAEGGTFPYATVSSKTTGSVRVKTYDSNFGTAADVNFSIICVGE